MCVNHISIFHSEYRIFISLKTFPGNIFTSYSLVLHWHHIKIASICGDMGILKACYKVWPLLTPRTCSFPPPAWWCRAPAPPRRVSPCRPACCSWTQRSDSATLTPELSHGFMQGLGFFVSSMRPDMFLRKRLCIFFSSISRSFTSLPMST